MAKRISLGWLLMVALGCGEAEPEPQATRSPATKIKAPSLPVPAEPQVAVQVPVNPPPPPVLVANGPPPRSVPLPDIFAAAPVSRGSANRTAAGGEAVSPAGSWKWTTNFGDQPVENVVNLKLDGNRLTGTYSRGTGNEVPILEASYRDGQVAFTVIRERKGEKIVSVYHGRLQGDTLRGTVELNFGGEQGRKRDWEATRAN